MYPRKRFAALLLCAVMLFASAGCKEKTKKDTGSKKPSSSQNSGADSVSSDSSDSSDQSSDVSSDGTLSTDSRGNLSDDITSSDSDNGYHTDRAIPTDSGNGNSSGSASVINYKTVSWSGPDGYVIVVPKGNKEAERTAQTIKQYFAKNASVTLKIVTDDTAAKDKEIIIGSTKRYKYSAKDGEYFAKVSGKKLIFGGGHDATVRAAVQTYTRIKYKKGSAYTFSVSSDFTATKLGYTYVWGDEFEGTTLDTKLWSRATKMAATAELMLDNTELTTRVENGVMKMFALRYWDPKRAGIEFAAPWSVTTYDTMSWKYGYMEMRARVPFVRGAWPSFWSSSYGSLGPDGKQRIYTIDDYSIEIDIFEVFSSVDTLAPNIHKWYGDGDHTMWNDENEKYTFDSADLNNEYHLYGFEWTPTEMSMYIDGKKYYTYDITKNFDNGASGMNGFNTQLHLILNNHLFTQSSSFKPYDGCEIYAADLPVEYDVDWVRLYQKNDGKSTLYLAK